MHKPISRKQTDNSMQKKGKGSKFQQLYMKHNIDNFD